MSNYGKVALAGAVLAMAVVASLLLLPETADAQGPPNRFFGHVFTNAPAPAPAGTDVVATINGNICGDTDVQADGTYVLDVLASGPPAFEPSVKPGCGTWGATVDFWVGGKPAGSGTWESGTFTQLDLSITADCMLGDDSGRGTGLLIWGDDWRFVAPGEDLAGSGVRWFFGRFLVFGRSGSAMVVAFGSCPWGGGTGMAMDLSARRFLRLVDTTSLAPGPPAPPPPPPAPPPPPGGEMEVIQLVAGCQILTSTYPDGTQPGTLAAAISPQESILGIWKFELLSALAWRGFHPAFVYASDMGPLQLLDGMFICMATPGTFVRPMI